MKFFIITNYGDFFDKRRSKKIKILKHNNLDALSGTTTHEKVISYQ